VVAVTKEEADSAIPPPTQALTRKFGVADAMILVAGFGFALASSTRLLVALGEQFSEMCSVIAGYNSPFYANRPAFWRKWVAIYWSSVLFYAIRVFGNFLLGMTPAFVIVRLRRPRPPIRALFKQPGFIAGLAIVFGQFWLTGRLHILYFGKLKDATVTGIVVAATVIVTWALLSLSRQWRSEPSWIDRIGRLLGASAIALGALSFALSGI
jgi:hypothetical protein